MWKNKKVAVVFPTYNEKESIRDAIEDFFNSGYVDEIIVVNNNAAAGTSEEVAKTKAVEVFETRQGYGFAIRRGLREADADLVIISEPDGTFCGKDVVKLLAYSDDFEVVFGTRTMSKFILKGANMGWFIKTGNMSVAKMVSLLFNVTGLTDMGCTTKLISKNALRKIESDFSIGSSHFGAEFMLLIILNKIKFTEIPVFYKKRIGKSSVTGSKWKAFKLGIIMVLFILTAKLKTFMFKEVKI